MIETFLQEYINRSSLRREEMLLHEPSLAEWSDICLDLQ